MLGRLFDEVSMVDMVVKGLDILIVYYVVYRILLTIKGTRAAQMLIGLVLIGACYFVAERLEMVAVSWLLDNFIGYFIIFVIVVFQQDIRRGLMRLGQNIVPVGRTHELSHALDEVIAAADHLAKARIGAIVVFEREADIGDFLDNGQLIDARVSRQLLGSLFVPSRDNDLHDGAVIIGKDLRILCAGAVLPLSRSTQLAEEFGTRHRAAVGITEETDAVAIVVSEERGEISLCFKGNVARDLELETLRRALQSLFQPVKRGAAHDQAHAAAAISKAVAALADAKEIRAATNREEPTPTSVRVAEGGES